jgi:hypothetical protein
VTGGESEGDPAIAPDSEPAVDQGAAPSPSPAPESSPGQAAAAPSEVTTEAISPAPVPEVVVWSLSNPCLQIPEEDEAMIDNARRRLAQTSCGAGLWFDGLFGEHGDVDAARRANGRVELSVLHSQFEGTEYRLRFFVRFDLRTLENRLSAFFGRDNQDDFARGRLEGFALRSQFPRLDEGDQWLAGLGYSLPSTERLQTNFRVGVHNLRLPKAFVQARMAYNAYSDHNTVVHLRGTPFWTSRDGFGITTSLDYSYVLAPTQLLRWGTAATLSQKTEGLDWRSALIFYQDMRGLGAVAFELFVRGATRQAEPLGEYGVRSIHRYPLIDGRLYSELVVGYTWPRTDPTLPREGSFQAGAGLEMPFGKK